MEAKDMPKAGDVFERYEVIDDIIYDMSPPPSSEHQSVVINLATEFRNYLRGKTCKVFPGPFGVWMTDKEREHVEPDITIVCDPSKIQPRGCVGVPDMVVEVLSPSTALKDKSIKLRLYRRSGVREYWIIDPVYELVEVYKLDGNTFTEPKVYGRDDMVSVGIFGDLDISLGGIFETL